MIWNKSIQSQITLFEMQKQRIVEVSLRGRQDLPQGGALTPIQINAGGRLSDWIGIAHEIRSPKLFINAQLVCESSETNVAYIHTGLSCSMADGSRIISDLIASLEFDPVF